MAPKTPKKKLSAAKVPASTMNLANEAAFGAGQVSELKQEIYRTRLTTANALSALKKVPHDDTQWNDALYAYTLADLAWRKSLSAIFNQADEIVRQTTLRLAKVNNELAQAAQALQNAARIAQFATQAATLAASLVGLL